MMTLTLAPPLCVAANWVSDGAMYVAPLLCFFAVYHVYPIVRSLEMSFTNFKYLAAADTHFVGLENYAEALNDRYVWNGVTVATEYLVIYIPVVVVISLGVALLLAELETANSGAGQGGKVRRASETGGRAD